MAAGLKQVVCACLRATPRSVFADWHRCYHLSTDACAHCTHAYRCTAVCALHTITCPGLTHICYPARTAAYFPVRLRTFILPTAAARAVPRRSRGFICRRWYRCYHFCTRYTAVAREQVTAPTPRTSTHTPANTRRPRTHCSTIAWLYISFTYTPFPVTHRLRCQLPLPPHLRLPRSCLATLHCLALRTAALTVRAPCGAPSARHYRKPFSRAASTRRIFATTATCSHPGSRRYLPASP